MAILGYLLEYAKNVRLKVTLRDTEEEADKVCSKVQRTFDNAVGKLPAVSYFNTKTNLRARLWNFFLGLSKWATVTKVELSSV